MLLHKNLVFKFKTILFFLLILPSLYWLLKYIQGNFGVNPIDKLMDELGQMSLRLITATLIISSVRDIS